MRLTDPRLLLSLPTLAVVGFGLYQVVAKTSPGPLSSTHAGRDELVSFGSCARCHGRRQADMWTACGECHEPIEQQILASSGLHGTLGQADPKDCTACHVEHHGPDFPLVTPASFARAGYETRESFDHGVVDFLLGGRHTELECKECHPNADVAELPAGELRFLGLDASCAACHEDVHEGAMVRACADCHGQEHPFADVAAFVHRRTKLEGAHAGLACADCHEEGTPWSVEALGRTPEPDSRTCVDCHDSPHGEAFTAAGCGDCHAPVHETFEGRRESMPLALHAASGFPLDAPHDDVACEDCHGPEPLPSFPGLSYAERFPGRRADDCAACHEDPHDDQFGARSCTDCHDRHGFEPPAFGPAQHVHTAFPLLGSHGKVECNACHERPRPEQARVFVGTPKECAACHEDAHRGLLDPALAEDCGACHVSTAFAHVVQASFDHGRATSFELEGAHARAECTSCHTPSARPDERGRSFGFAADLARGPVEECASCHEDVHEGTFPDAEDCSACHDEESFRAAEHGFDHERWTGFLLDGAHARASCEACHPRSAFPDAAHRTFGRVSETFGVPTSECSTCHEDPHRGLFERPGPPTEVAGRDGCARCHVTESFSHPVESFDHELWTGYRLSPEHAALACAACHPPLRGRSEALAGSRLGPAAGRACADCHADPHAGQFLVAGITDCARCHLDEGGLAFDHDRDSRFPLDRTHAPLACSACHVPWPLPDGTEVVRYRPLGRECADCHGPGEEWKR